MVSSSNWNMWRLAAAALAMQAGAGVLAEQKPLHDGAAAKRGKNPFTSDFKTYVDGLLDEWKVAGMSIGVVDGDDVFTEGFGYAQLPDVPATSDTLWYVGSTTKAQLAATIAHFIDNKTYPELSAGWTTPISSILRDDFVLQDAYMTEHATLEDAVCHRTGMLDHTNAMPHVMADGRPATTRDHVRNMRNLPLTRTPRTEFHYNNWMFTTLSHVVETLTGEWLGDTLRKYLWEPLGMENTYLSVEDALASDKHLARGYYWDTQKEAFGEFPLWAAPELSGAGIAISNVVDYTKWIRCLLRQEEPLSKAAHADIRLPRMLSDPVPTKGMEVGLYGLAWFRTTFHGQVLYHHTGSIPSHGAIVYWLPELDYGLVAFHNYPDPMKRVVAMRLLEDRLEIPESERYNISGVLHDEHDTARKLLDDPLDFLYPDRPETPLPPSFNNSDLVGTYHDAGYGTLTLREEPHPEHADETILVADRADKSFQHSIHLHRVSGDYWIVYYYQQYESMNGPMDAHVAEFKAGVDGRPTGFEENVQPLGEVSHGIVFYEKVE